MDCVNGKEMGHFCCEKAAFFKHFGLQLDLDFTFEQIFGLILEESGLDLDRKIWQSAHLSPPAHQLVLSVEVTAECHCTSEEKPLKLKVKSYQKYKTLLVLPVYDITLSFTPPSAAVYRYSKSTAAELSTDQDWSQFWQDQDWIGLQFFWKLADQDRNGLRIFFLFKCDYSENIKNFSCDPIPQVC